jgi:hypothetical protein
MKRILTLTSLVAMSLVLSAQEPERDPGLDNVNSLIEKHSAAKDRYNAIIDKYNEIWKDVSPKEKAQLAIETKATDSLLNVVYFETMTCLHSQSELGKQSCQQARDHLDELNEEITYYENEIGKVTGTFVQANISTKIHGRN